MGKRGGKPLKTPAKSAGKKVTFEDDGRDKRNPALNEEQKEAMLSYMEKHTNFARGRLEKCPNAALKMDEMRKKLAARINAEPGQNRTPAMWWKSWIDLRNWAKKFAADNYQPKDMRTGGGGDESINSLEYIPPKKESIDFDNVTSTNDIVDRIMAIIGWRAALGTGLRDDLDDEPTISRGSAQNREEEELIILSDDDTETGSIKKRKVTTHNDKVFTSTPAKKLSVGEKKNSDGEDVLMSQFKEELADLSWEFGDDLLLSPHQSEEQNHRGKVIHILGGKPNAREEKPVDEPVAKEKPVEKPVTREKPVEKTSYPSWEFGEDLLLSPRQSEEQNHRGKVIHLLGGKPNVREEKPFAIEKPVVKPVTREKLVEKTSFPPLNPRCNVDDSLESIYGSNSSLDFGTNRSPTPIPQTKNECNLGISSGGIEKMPFLNDSVHMVVDLVRSTDKSPSSPTNDKTSEKDESDIMSQEQAAALVTALNENTAAQRKLLHFFKSKICFIIQNASSADTLEPKRQQENHSSDDRVVADLLLKMAEGALSLP